MRLPRLLIILGLIASFLIVGFFKINYIHADECATTQDLDVIKSCINQYSGTRDLIAKANTSNKADLKKLRDRINSLKAQIDNLVLQLSKKEKEINKRNLEFDKKYEELAAAIRSLYIKHYYPAGLTIIFGAESATDVFRLASMYSFLSKRNRDTIVNLVTEIGNLQKEKTKLGEIASQTTALKTQVDERAAFLEKEVAKANAYEEQLQSQIAALTARQQQILSERLASLNISRSAAALGRCDSDLTNGRDPGFSPKFAAFTYGVPNRVGLNQWGAYGRAKAGQSYDQILRSYYNFDEYKNFDQNTKINVEGYGNYNLDDYVKRIYEVPGDWPSEVLKAQAIAARSYALAYTNNGSGSICATESCQVFKADPKGGAWEQAVNDTGGKIMAQGGKAIKAWFSSTHGGYVRTSAEIGWGDTSWTKHLTDTNSGIGSFSDLQNNSYDKESPWFYCDWGSRSQYNKTAWLKPEELADIVNVILLARKDSGTREHLYQTDHPPSGTDTWNIDRVRQELGSSAYKNISEVSVSVDWNGGRTTSVSLSGDAGSQNFDGSEFKNFFNLRAPANIQIVGPLFNIEKK
ncbi:hypothetical protein HY030_01425 [Candidatus Gottesmanbacteria bacterium]|nr:hypothetical protein [Candidatus Gottesmanbacteria bacterium]